jgi:glycosyltransferase involved in cell wall biosynthesis
MPVSHGTGVVIYQARAGIDAIDQYSRHLVQAISASGSEARYIPDGPAAALGVAGRPSWVLLQYNPFVYGRAGFAPHLLVDVQRLRRVSRAPLALMVHEAWVDMNDAKSRLIGLWQRAQLRALLPSADRVMTSTEALAREIGRGAIHVPISANITPVTTTHEMARARLALDGKLTIALFGRGNPGRALDHAEAAIGALADAHGADRLVVLNLGADAPALRVRPEIEVISPGRLPADELSVRLWASDIVLLPFHDGVSTRRSTLMAAFAHARPVLGLLGRNTDMLLGGAHDALALTPAGDRSAFSRAAVELTCDPRRMTSIGRAGRRLYETHFDWPHTARRVLAAVESIGPRSSPAAGFPAAA